MAERVAQPLSMPVLTIGAKGGVGKRLAESLEGTALILSSVIPDGGHFLPEESPSDFAQAVIGFWNETEPFVTP